MVVDTATSATQVLKKHVLLELEIYCYLLVLIFLIDKIKYNKAKACSSTGIARLKNMNRRTVDVLASRLYFYYSLSYEHTGDDLAKLYLMILFELCLRACCFEETLLNLLLYNYLPNLRLTQNSSDHLGSPTPPSISPWIPDTTTTDHGSFPTSIIIFPPRASSFPCLFKGWQHHNQQTHHLLNQSRALHFSPLYLHQTN